MSRQLAFLALLALVPCNPARPDALITFSAGPDFTARISTPWGSYLVDDEGASIWVGTEEEYINRKALSIAHQQGYREMHIDGGNGGKHYLVSEKLPSTRIGSVDIAGIDIVICFDCKPDRSMERPTKAIAAQYVAVDWTQSASYTTSATLYNPKTLQTYRPYTCYQLEGSAHLSACQFVVANSDIAAPMCLVFTEQGSKPAAINIDSITNSSYRNVTGSSREMRLPLSAEARTNLIKLHALDPSIHLPP